MPESLLNILLFICIGILSSLIYLRRNEGYGVTSRVRSYKKAGSKPNPLFTPTRCKCGEVPQQGPSVPFRGGCSPKNVIDPMKTFTPSLNSQCKGGAYMYTSNPTLTEVCAHTSSLGTCNQPGFQGRPVSFEYLNLSDKHWRNPLSCGSNGTLPATARGVVGPPLRPLEQEALAQGDQICVL